MNCKGDNTQGPGNSGPCPCALTHAINGLFKLADDEFEAHGVLTPQLTLHVRGLTYIIDLDFTDCTAKQTSMQTIRDCCVAFMPEAAALLQEAQISPVPEGPAADDPYILDVVAVLLETPYVDVQVFSRIQRDEDGAYAGRDTPLRCDDLRNGTGVSGFYPSLPVSPQQRDDARNRLRRVLKGDFLAAICATADQPAEAA